MHVRVRAPKQTHMKAHHQTPIHNHHLKPQYDFLLLIVHNESYHRFLTKRFHSIPQIQHYYEEMRFLDNYILIEHYTQFGIQQQLGAPLDNTVGITYIPERNNAQLPAMQHLDIVFNFISQKEKGVRIFSISVFNVFASPIITNYSDLDVSDSMSRRGTVKGTGPWAILPTFSYSYQF